MIAFQFNDLQNQTKYPVSDHYLSVWDGAQGPLSILSVAVGLDGNSTLTSTLTSVASSFNFTPRPLTIRAFQGLTLRPTSQQVHQSPV